ncbi:hypothetical protein EWM64_g4241 [Hericium alpestre]|uniref:Uncharacterized protein n=1 Tax=Hericium alpestre TaxID=135208 RepID=A0A4Z0A018_9AGAM|nr:hypothetical protein EWM64_g4241 [Hericium alpestre]
MYESACELTYGVSQHRQLPVSSPTRCHALPPFRASPAPARCHKGVIVKLVTDDKAGICACRAVFKTVVVASVDDSQEARPATSVQQAVVRA